MEREMAVDGDIPHEAVHEALRAWHATGDAEPALLAELLLVRQHRAALPDATSPLSQRLATNELLLAAIARLEEQDEIAAQLLRWRFLDDQTLMSVSHRLNVSEYTVSRMQRSAIAMLTAIIGEQERDARAALVDELESGLPPPTYTRLFGVAGLQRELADLVLAGAAPWVAAVVGMGGIGKTALVDAVTRDVIPTLRFERVIWIRFDARTLTGRSLSPEHTFHGLLAQLASWLNVDGTNLPEEQLAQVRHRLKRAPHLVIVDNVESMAVTDFLLNHLVELANPGKFLLTTRIHPSGQAAVRTFSLPTLERADAGALLRHHAGELGVSALAQAPDEEIDRIYAVTGGNPLALKLVAGLLDLLPLSRVLQDLARSRPGPVEELYRHIYWQSWRTLNEPAKALLQAMPLVSEDGASDDYLQALSGLSDDAFWPALQELRARSLIEVRGTLDEKRYGVHRLTETFVRTEIVGWDHHDE
ncbi:MAG: NB-ARC domain-containing protein [Anaerolineae bacterium]|nr:NB-ARC domain-containing protein [Anaerolineae bacterium]